MFDTLWDEPGLSGISGPNCALRFLAARLEAKGIKSFEQLAALSGEQIEKDFRTTPELLGVLIHQLDQRGYQLRQDHGPT